MTDIATADLLKIENFFQETQSSWSSQLNTYENTSWREKRHASSNHTSIARSISHGSIFEKAAINFSSIEGSKLSSSALQHHDPAIANQPFCAFNVSMILHPNNPHVPVLHANMRFFQTLTAHPYWWFGAAMDLNPCYGYRDDCVHWHTTCHKACDGFGTGLYQKLKSACDEYFYLPHRQEHRGIGGLWLEYHNTPPFQNAFALVQAIGHHVMPGYLPILARRYQQDYTPEQKKFQMLRRGRYAEFNLLCDRGTRYGLQSSKKADTVLVSMPPQCIWEIDYPITPESPEALLVSDFLTPKDWLTEVELCPV